MKFFCLVFDGLPVLKNYSGWMLLLEEDHYVSPDFFVVMKEMVNEKEAFCSECSVITLGYYLKTYANYADHMDKVRKKKVFRKSH